MVVTASLTADFPCSSTSACSVERWMPSSISSVPLHKHTGPNDDAAAGQHARPEGFVVGMDLVTATVVAAHRGSWCIL